jgi:hypothetical protein
LRVRTDARPVRAVTPLREWAIADRRCQGRHAMLDWLEQAFGALLVLLVLLDVFLTVLYARIGASLISGTVARVTWRLFLWLSKPLGQNRAVALSCCGPAILVLLVAIWAFGLTCGTALIIHPKLGTSVRVSSGDTPTDFVTAMYAGGSSVAIVGASDFTPHTSAFRMLFCSTPSSACPSCR